MPTIPPWPWHHPLAPAITSWPCRHLLALPSPHGPAITPWACHHPMALPSPQGPAITPGACHHPLGLPSPHGPAICAYTESAHVNSTHLICRSDTFFIASMHRVSAADCGGPDGCSVNHVNHRGGYQGSVQADRSGKLWWGDYAGNNACNTLGDQLVAVAAHT